MFPELFHTRGPYYIETSPMTCSANQCTGFYTIGTSDMKELTSPLNPVRRKEKGESNENLNFPSVSSISNNYIFPKFSDLPALSAIFKPLILAHKMPMKLLKTFFSKKLEPQKSKYIILKKHWRSQNFCLMNTNVMLGTICTILKT